MFLEVCFAVMARCSNFKNIFLFIILLLSLIYVLLSFHDYEARYRIVGASTAAYQKEDRHLEKLEVLDNKEKEDDYYNLELMSEDGEDEEEENQALTDDLLSKIVTLIDSDSSFGNEVPDLVLPTNLSFREALSRWRANIASVLDGTNVTLHRQHNVRIA